MTTPRHIPAGLILEATEALKSDQRTFGRYQVAILISLAFESGREHGRNEVLIGQDDALGDQIDAMRQAFDPGAKTLKQAIGTHLKGLGQKEAREAADRTARDPRPHGLRLDDPDWPTVTVPGTKPPAEPSRCPTTAAPTTTRAAA